MGSNRVPTDLIPPIVASSTALRPPVDRPLFLPAGSFSSRPGSTLNSETDREDREDGEESESGYLPTQENSLFPAHIILFESSTPLPSSRSLLPGPEPCELAHTLNPLQTGFLTGLLDTIESESDPRVCRDPEKLLRELENYRSSCLQYESQNEALRREVQSCATDLRAVDKSKRKVLSENSKLAAVLSDYRSAVGRLGEVSEKLGEVLGTEGGERQSEDVRHMCNHLAGQIDILCSRYNRSRAMSDRLTEENEKMRRELEAMRKAHSSGERLASAIHTKEAQIDHLEDKLQGYQSRLSSGSTTSTLYYSSGRASADDSKSPLSGKDSESAGITPNNTPAVSFLAPQRREDLGKHVRTRSSKDGEEKGRRGREGKGKGSCSPCVRAYLKGGTPCRRPVSPATGLLKDFNFTLKPCANTTSSSRLAQTTVLKGKTGLRSRKACRV